MKTAYTLSAQPCGNTRDQRADFNAAFAAFGENNQYIVHYLSSALESEALIQRGISEGHEAPIGWINRNAGELEVLKRVIENGVRKLLGPDSYQVYPNLHDELWVVLEN